MITVTEPVRQRITRFFESRGTPEAGLRLSLTHESPDSTADPELDVTLADGPQPGDIVRTVNGVRFFIPHDALSLANDAELSLDEAELSNLLGDAPPPPVGTVLAANRDATFGDDIDARPAAYRRPLWLVGILTFATFGAYGLLWFGRSWAELKRVRRDDTMHPWWHTLSLFVPIYGLFRVHEHFAMIHAQANSVARSAPIGGGAAVFLMIVVNVLGTAGSRAPSPLDDVASLAGTFAVSALVVLGQAGLNACWSGYARAEVPRRVHWLEWLLLIPAVPWSLLLFVVPWLPD